MHRHLADWQFAAAAVGLVLLEALAFQALGAPYEAYRDLLLLSAYVPLNFLFFCNVVNVGLRREWIWTASLLLLCLGSLLAFGSLRLDLILPLSLGTTVTLCLQAMRDPWRHYRMGLRCLDQGRDARRAAGYLARALDLQPGEARFLYHLGRARLRLGEEEAGRGLVEEALRRDPDLPSRLSRERGFRPDWLVTRQE